MFDHELGNIVSKHELNAEKLSKWFHDKNVKLNDKKFQFFEIWMKSTNLSVQIGATSIVDQQNKAFESNA